MLTTRQRHHAIPRPGPWRVWVSLNITYEWTDEEGLTFKAYDVAGTPGQGKTYSATKRIPFPGPGAAAAIVNRAEGKGRLLTVESLSNYETTPGMDLSITIPDAPLQTGVVSRVTWSFPDATMTVGSRGLTDTPPTAWRLAEGPWTTAAGTWAGAMN